MKKLLAMYICVSALIYGFNAIASGLDMPPHDNSYTHYSLVPESVFDNSSSYQIARTYFMPDYQRNLVGKRVDDGGKGTNSKACANYGFVDECPTGQIGTKVSPVAGLSCYKNCKAVDCKEYGLVSKADCPLHWMVLGESKKIGGVSCYEFCACDTVSYYKYTEYNCRRIGKKAGGEKCNFGLECDYQGHCELDSVGDNWHYTECVCPEEYSLSSCPANANCTQCDSKYKISSCKEGYILSGNECVLAENCSAYPLTVCPAGGTCSECPDNSTKLKLDSCDTSKGWKMSGNTCEAVSCPAGYTAGVTSCTSGSTKPDYSSNGWSGGQQCGVCKCNNATDCSAYTLTSQSDANANYDSCTTGCGSEKVTKYKITGCKANYKLVAGVCKSDICPSGYTTNSCVSPQQQTGISITDAGSACYKCEAKQISCADYNYLSSIPASEYDEKWGCDTVSVEGLTCYTECYIETKLPILYSDWTEINRLYPDKTPIAIVLDQDKGVAVALDEQRIFWSADLTHIWEKVPVTASRENDFDGYGNTQIWKSKVCNTKPFKACYPDASDTCNGYSVDCPTFKYAYQYVTEGTLAGKWYVPAYGELLKMHSLRSEINTIINSINFWSNSGVEAAPISVNDFSHGSGRYASSTSDYGAENQSSHGPFLLCIEENGSINGFCVHDEQEYQIIRPFISYESRWQ